MKFRNCCLMTLCISLIFISSPPAAERCDGGQKLIRDFGMEQYGEGLYNDAAYAKQYD